jgi:hypothetical protein
VFPNMSLNFWDGLRLATALLVALLSILPSATRSQSVTRWQVTITVKDSAGRVILRNVSVTNDGATLTVDQRKLYPQPSGIILWTGLHAMVTPIGLADGIQARLDVEYQWIPDGGDPSQTSVPKDIHATTVARIPAGEEYALNGPPVSGSPVGDRALYLQMDPLPQPQP